MDFEFVDTSEPDLPLYSDKGNIIVEIVDTCPHYTWSIERYNYDADASPFFVNEGMGIAYWVFLHSHDILHTGVWVFEGVHGSYIRGDWGFTDDDEEWYYDSCRLATKEEIEAL